MASSATNIDKIETALRSPTDLTVYQTQFEIPYVENMQAYYSDKARDWIISLDIPTYLGLVNDNIAKEIRRFLILS